MIAIIDYGAGNVASVANAVARLGSPFIITSDIKDLDEANKIIFPGVGEASFAVNRLRESGLIKFLQDTKKPLLGICLGMQLLCDHSEEGNVDGLGIFPINVVKFKNNETKVPHIGWNTVQSLTAKATLPICGTRLGKRSVNSLPTIPLIIRSSVITSTAFYWRPKVSVALEILLLIQQRKGREINIIFKRIF